MNKNLLLIALLVFIHLQLCNSQVLQFGTCPEVTTMKFFEIEKFLGKWYEIERFPTWYENFGNCAYKTIQACGRQIEIEHGFVRDGIQYVLHVNSTYSPGAEAIFFIQENNIDPIGIPLSVIATDYINYAIVYGCKNNYSIGLKYISAWILSRTATLPDEIKKQAYDELNAVPYVSTAHLEEVVQNEENCSFFWTAHVQAAYGETDEKSMIIW